MTFDFQNITAARRRGSNVALCLVVSTKGSSPRQTGAKMLVYEDGKIEGTIGGGELERKVIEDAAAVLKKRRPELFRHDLLHQHNMCCGGSVDIYIEPVMRKARLYIFGAGHVGQALARYANDIDLEVVLIDDRSEYIAQCTVEGVNKMNLSFEQALQVLPFDPETFICIATYDHATDREILAHCIRKPHGYLGMIGSERKVKMTRKIFLEAGVATANELDRVDMPMGMAINAEGPAEIAFSIVSILIKVKHQLHYV